jgi:DNA-binding CsgD family transcriptional regulator
MTATIIGRDDELAAIQAFPGRVEQGPCALVLSGEAGIGKTVLWETGVEEAGRRAVRVLVGRGAEAEASLSFAGLSDLLADAFDEVSRGLAPIRRHALEVALLLTEPGGAPPEPRLIGLALLDVLRSLSEQGPVLLALDDVQWLDAASAGAIQIALRRLRDEQLGLLATLRLGQELSNPLQLEHSFAGGRFERLTLGALSLGAIHRLLEERLGLELSRAELGQIQEATAGNPFFALELGRELVRTNTRPTPGQALRVPDSLRELLGGRLARLPGETLDVLLLVAALARPTVELLAATYGDKQRVLDALEAAAQETVVELDDSHVRFAHPLLASICYERAPVWKRRAVHAALADAVYDVEERARHLALAVDGPDDGVATELDIAAGHAAARGATAAAAGLCLLAAELTPGGSIAARQRRVRAADYSYLAGDVDRATVLYEQLLVDAPPGVERADVLFGLLKSQNYDTRAMIELYEQALVEASDDDARSARILAWQMGIRLYQADARSALTDARAAVEKAERTRDPFLLAITLARASLAEGYAGDITPGLIERAVEIEQREAFELDSEESPRYAHARLLMRFGDLDRARDLFDELEQDVMERGDETSRVMILWYETELEWLAGRWERALELAAAAYELTGQTQYARGRASIGRQKALLETDLGLVDQARATAQEGLTFSEETEKDHYTILTLGVLGRLELELGNLAVAADHLRALPARLLTGGMNDPTFTLWADAIETLIGLSEFAQARSYLEQYELNAHRFRSPQARAGAARCRGLLLAGEGDASAAFEAFERSLTDAQKFPLEHGRTLLCLGTVRRQAQQKKAAREALAQAQAIFDELGARLWAEKARAELRRISGRAPASDELTETERRVAELAARGRTNKQIAAELYMGLSTVESHLSNAYRKLGVRRAGLAARLGAKVDEVVEA